ncbi:hypothetical protein K4039_11740 [Lyngbya sp. CCAP 1446/10]|nr:hypothetical protein [Lyngbya sp. CCAP 1446/10]MCW6050740.1 hypothetical protein [Lyngbya sp. CCAP 1446/10]
MVHYRRRKKEEGRRKKEEGRLEFVGCDRGGKLLSRRSPNSALTHPTIT